MPRHFISSQSIDEEKNVLEIMAFFNCNKDLAKTILKSSKLNGNIDSIKNICHQANQREKR